MATQTETTALQKCDHGHALGDLMIADRHAELLTQITGCPSCIALLSKNLAVLDLVPETIERDILRTALAPYEPPAGKPSATASPREKWTMGLLAATAILVTIVLVPPAFRALLPSEQPVSQGTDVPAVQTNDDAVRRQPEPAHQDSRHEPSTEQTVAATRVITATRSQRVAASELFDPIVLADGWMTRLDDPEEKERRFKEMYADFNWSDFVTIHPARELILKNNSAAPAKYLLVVRRLNVQILDDERRAARLEHGDQADRVLDKKHYERTVELEISPGHSVQLVPADADVVVAGFTLLDIRR